ncbi:MAG TPA: EAL domain-containing protein [Sphingomicrobium sp.]|nr:EAL domain-containing protein [Sphingomicrobium sp.]
MIVPALTGRFPLTAGSSIQDILHAARQHLGMKVAFVSEFVGGRRVFRYVDCGTGERLIEVGGSDPLEESYCHWVAEKKLPELIRDPAEHPFTRHLAATKAVPVGAHISVPIRLRDGELFGTFCCFSQEPDRSLTERDLATMHAFAQVAGAQIQVAIDGRREKEAKHTRIRAILDAGNFDIVHQPAVRIDCGRVEFVEALARFRSEPVRPPNEWFEEATEVGLAAELETLVTGRALQTLEVIPETVSLSVNISPAMLAHGDLCDRLRSALPHRLILEITEHKAVGCYQALRDSLAPLRSRGLRLAIDDAGAGYSSFRHILELRPDIIKLDMSLCRGLERDSAKRALVSSLLSFSRAVGCEIVAEGVETEAELASLRRIGIMIAQGHLLARPARPVPGEFALAGAA